ncbi:MAG: zinc ribbon domain-containing protein [Pseudomonadales bacterium]|nr:zinc ribbon domain-containing protein [Pseudomonadales bacterium]
MPIYEYGCESCTHKFETLQKFNEAPLTKCPVCEKETLNKLISAAAFRLKGGGWYETDFKSGDKKNLAGSESSDNSSSSGKEASGESGSSQSPKKVEKKAKGSKSETSTSAGVKKADASKS